MWWRRWISPEVGSVASWTLSSASCARRMPRREGDVRLFATAMMALLTNASASTMFLAVFQQLAQVRERMRRCFPAIRILRLLLSGRVPFALQDLAAGLDGHQRQRQQQFVLDHLARLQRSVLQQQRLAALRQCRRIFFAGQQSQPRIHHDRPFEWLQRTLALQHQPRRQEQMQLGVAEFALLELEIVDNFAGILRQRLDQPRQFRDRQDTLERSPPGHHALGVHRSWQGRGHKRGMLDSALHKVNRRARPRIGPYHACPSRASNMQGPRLPSPSATLLAILLPALVAVIACGGVVWLLLRQMRHQRTLRTLYLEADGIEHDLKECRQRLQRAHASMSLGPSEPAAGEAHAKLAIDAAL